MSIKIKNLPQIESLHSILICLGISLTSLALYVYFIICNMHAAYVFSASTIFTISLVITWINGLKRVVYLIDAIKRNLLESIDLNENNIIFNYYNQCSSLPYKHSELESIKLYIKFSQNRIFKTYKISSISLEFKNANQETRTIFDETQIFNSSVIRKICKIFNIFKNNDNFSYEIIGNCKKLENKIESYYKNINSK